MMVDASAAIVIVLVAALLVRVVLDLGSTRRPALGFDVAYVVLFLVVGALGIVDNATSIWGWVALAVSAWSPAGIFVKRKKATRAS